MTADKISGWMQKLANREVRLLNELEITSEEFEELKIYFTNKIVKNKYVSDCEDIKLSVFLVNVAIEKYADGKFWDCLDELLGIEIPGTRKTKAKEIFFKTLATHRLLRLPSGKTIPYTEMIKAHAFVTNNYMDGFFDFAEAYYREVLFCQLNKSDLKKDIEALSDFMNDSLLGNDTLTLEERSGKAPRTYRLLKSTREVFAYMDAENIIDLFFPILDMFDKYHRYLRLPDGNNRFERHFISWCKKQENDDNIQPRKVSGISSRKPFITFNNAEYFVLNIPKQRFYANECDGSAYVVIELGEDDEKSSERRELDPYKKCGIYISDELSIMLPTPFENLRIKIYGIYDDTPIREYKIEGSLYRILDSKYKCISKLKNGENMLAVSHGCMVHFSQNVDVSDRMAGREYDLFSFHCMDGAYINVGNKILRYTTADYVDIEFEEEDSLSLNSFSASDENGEELRCTSRHPLITVSVQKQLRNGVVLRINDMSLPLSDLRNNYSFAVNEESDTDLADKITYTIDLNTLCGHDGGYFQISVIIPSKSTKQYTWKYLLFPEDFRLSRNKRFYYYGEECKIKIRQNYQNSVEIEPVIEPQYSKNKEIDKDIYVSYIYTCDENIGDTIDFSIYVIGRKLTLHVPIMKFKFGSTADELECKPTYFWYKELPANLYISIPGASSAEILFNTEDCERTITATNENNVFRFELGEIKEMIISGEKTPKYKLDLSFVDIKKKSTSLTVCRQLIFKNLYGDNRLILDGEENTLRINIPEIRYADKAELFAEITDDVNGDIVYSDRLIAGENVVKNINPYHCYTIRPYMLEKALFAKKRTQLKWWRVTALIDIDDLSQYYVDVKYIQYNKSDLYTPDYNYGFDCINKVGDGVYTARMFVTEVNTESGEYKPKKTLANAKFTIVKYRQRRDRIEVTLEIRTEDGDYAEPYYDVERQMILNPSNKRLTSPSAKKIQYQNFIPLFEEDTRFILNLKRRKERKNDI